MIAALVMLVLKCRSWRGNEHEVSIPVAYTSIPRKIIIKSLNIPRQGNPTAVVRVQPCAGLGSMHRHSDCSGPDRPVVGPELA
jgi:hypothetical protein